MVWDRMALAGVPEQSPGNTKWGQGPSGLWATTCSQQPLRQGEGELSCLHSHPPAPGMGSMDVKCAGEGGRFG